MKIAFNPSTVAALIAPPNNKDITFDLRGQNIFARGVKFCGTDTNTWRDIKINNVSIDSNTLDLRDGDNTTLTNINGVVTINSTWRPVVDNLTSDSTTSSLSANLGRVLKALIDGKSDSDHNHDDRYLRLTGGLMLGDITFGGDNKIIWGRNTDSASISFKNDGDGDADSYMSFVTSDNGNEYFRWSHSSGSTNTEWMSLRSDGLRVGGTKVSLEGHSHNDLYYTKTEVNNKLNSKSDTSHTHDDRYLKLTGGIVNGVVGINATGVCGNSVLTVGPQDKRINTGIVDRYGTMLQIVGTGKKNEGGVIGFHNPSLYSAIIGFVRDTNETGFIFDTDVDRNSWYVKARAFKGNLIGDADSVDGIHMRWSHNTRDTWIPVLSNGNLDYILKSELVGQYNSASATKLQTARTIWGQSFDGTANVDNTLRIRQTTGNYCEGIRIQTADSTWATIILGATGDSGTNANAWSIHRKSDNNFAISRNSSDGTNGLVMTSTGMGLGTTSPTQRLDVHGNIRATGLIIREASPLLWVNGRRGALLRETTSTGYHTLWSLKTTNGSWDFGEYNEPGWNNIPVLSYITDTNFNSNNNTPTYQIRFPLDSGTIALTKNIPTSLPANGGNADTVDNYHIADESRQVYKNSYTVASPAGTWILIKFPAWNGYNEIVTISGYGDNRHAHCVVHCGSRNQGIWGYQSNYNCLVVSKIRWKEVDSGKFALVALIDGGITNLSIKSTNSLEISKTTEDNTAFAISASFFSSGGVFHGNVDWDKIIGKPSSFTPSEHTHPYLPLSGGTLTGALTIDFNHSGGGTTSSLLNVLFNGTHDYGIVAKFHSYGGDSPAIRFSHSSNKNEYNSQVNTNWSVGMRHNTYTDFAITLDRGTSGWGTVRFAINNSGNVGIGINSASYKLHVAGDIYTTTGFKKNGSSDSYVLLGGGGHKAVSDFAPSLHSHNYAANENYGGFTKSGRLPISGFYQSVESESGGNAPWSSWMHLINCLHSNTNNNYALLIAASFYDNNTFKIRVTNDDVNNTWRDIIHSGNIGSQSVNYANSAGNADKLDGTHLNGIFTTFGNNKHNITATIGGVTKEFLVNYASDADKVDGYHVSSGSNNPWGTIPVITTLGYMEIGKNLEFHYDNTTGSDYSTALMCQGNYSNIVYLPSASGTLALTSDIPTVTNYYWANVKISTSSSTTTSPTVSNLTATSSIKMGNILLEHTDEINSTSGIYLNYRTSGNISLCQGGGNVGIGTSSPLATLDVGGTSKFQDVATFDDSINANLDISLDGAFYVRYNNHWWILPFLYCVAYISDGVIIKLNTNYITAVSEYNKTISLTLRYSANIVALIQPIDTGITWISPITYKANGLSFYYRDDADNDNHGLNTHIEFNILIYKY